MITHRKVSTTLLISNYESLPDVYLIDFRYGLCGSGGTQR